MTRYIVFHKGELGIVAGPVSKKEIAEQLLEKLTHTISVEKGQLRIGPFRATPETEDEERIHPDN
jgi:hypothetical protein